MNNTIGIKVNAVVYKVKLMRAFIWAINKLPNFKSKSKNTINIYFRIYTD